MTFRPMPLLTVLSVISFVILMLLGNWQYARYGEKIGIDPAEQNPPQTLVIRLKQDQDVMFQQVYGKADSKPIWRRYALGTLDGSGEDVLVMVGATVGANPIPQAVSKLSEMITIEGNLLERTATKGLFGVEDEPEKNTWFTMDPQAIAAALGSEVAAIRVVEPVTLTLLNSGTQGQFSQMPNPYAFAKPLDPLPPERHFGYALTWWGMAIGLLGVYLALHHSKGRLRFRKA